MKSIKVDSAEGLKLVSELILAKDAYETKSRELEQRFQQEAEFLRTQATAIMSATWSKILDFHGLVVKDPEVHMLDAGYLKEHGIAFIRIEEDAEAEAELDEVEDLASMFPAPDTVQ